MDFRMGEKPSHGRRSKLDIVGDILRVISEGAEKPTNIMFRANLTWPLTVAYVEVLLRHDMIRMEDDGSRFVYRVAPKGIALLKSFIQTEEAAAELELDKIDTTLLQKMSASKARAKEEPTSLEAIRALRERQGFHVVAETRRGLSGVEHTFDMVMEDGKGGKVGYLVSTRVEVGDIIRAFILQTDCELQMQVLCLAQPNAEAIELAKSYKITLIPVKNGK